MKRLRWRAFHRAWAWLGGYFWLPCPICGQMFGGHERSGFTMYCDDDGRSSLVCPSCQLSPGGRRRPERISWLWSSCGVCGGLIEFCPYPFAGGWRERWRHVDPERDDTTHYAAPR